MANTKGSMSLVSVWTPVPPTARATAVPLSAHPSTSQVAYCQGNSVYLRDINDPGNSIIYTGHKFKTSVARFSPCGVWVATGDERGNAHFWRQPDAKEAAEAAASRVVAAPKYEYTVLAGRIRDIAVDHEGKRAIAAGEGGRDKVAHAFFVETGASVGKITGHVKPINAVAIRGARPLRAATVSDDMAMVFHTGVPFKFDHERRLHTRFPTCVSFDPTGALLATAGLDGCVALYDGASGAPLAPALQPTQPQLQLDANSHHDGGIYALTWAASPSAFATASADGFVKIWDSSSSSFTTTTTKPAPVASFDVGACVSRAGTLLGADSDAVARQLLGLAYVARDRVYVASSITSSLVIVDPRLPRGYASEIQGHTKGISAVAACANGSALVTGDEEGALCVWQQSASAGASASSSSLLSLATRVDDNRVHHGAVVGITALGKGLSHALAISSDGVASLIDVKAAKKVAHLEALPRGVTSVARLGDSQNNDNDNGRDSVLVGHAAGVFELTVDTGDGSIKLVDQDKGHAIGAQLKETAPCIVATSSMTPLVAVGVMGDEANARSISPKCAEVRVFAQDGASFKEVGAKIATNSIAVSRVGVTPCGKRVAVATAQGQIRVHELEGTAAFKQVGEWNAHSSSVAAIALGATAKVTGGVDSQLVAWDDSNGSMYPRPRVVAHAHRGGVSDVVLVDEGRRVVSVGNDACVRTWET